MHWRRLIASFTGAVVVAACNNGHLLEPQATDTDATTDSPIADCGHEVDGPGLSRAGTPGAVVYQEADGQGLVVVGPDGREQGRIAAPPLKRGYPVGIGKALYEAEAGGLVLVDARQLTATRLPGPVDELVVPYASDGGRRFLPVTMFAGEGGEIVEIEAATATDLADVIGGGSIEGVHVDDAEINLAVFTPHGVWITDTNFLADAKQLDPAAIGDGDISADGCAVAYFRGDSDSGTLDVVVARVDDGNAGERVASVEASGALFTELQWVGRRLIACGGSGAALVDVATGAVHPFGTGHCIDVVRDLHRSEAILSIGDPVNPRWFHVGPTGDPEPLPALDGYSATAVSTSDLVPLWRNPGEPNLIYSFAVHTIRTSEPLPPATSVRFDDLIPGAVIYVMTQTDGDTTQALAVDLRDGKVHTAGDGIPSAAPDGSAVVTVTGTALAIVPIPTASGQPLPIGDGTIPVWTVAQFGSESGGANP